MREHALLLRRFYYIFPVPLGFFLNYISFGLGGLYFNLSKMLLWEKMFSVIAGLEIFLFTASFYMLNFCVMKRVVCLYILLRLRIYAAVLIRLRVCSRLRSGNFVY